VNKSGEELMQETFAGSKREFRWPLMELENSKHSYNSSKSFQAGKLVSGYRSVFVIAQNDL